MLLRTGVQRVLRPLARGTTRRNLATEKELKIRMTSVKSISKITKASKMVAAAKLRGIERALKAGRPFTDAIFNIWKEPTKEGKEATSAAAVEDENESTAVDLMIVPLTAERGLCGGVNSSVIRMTKTLLNEAHSKNESAQIFVVGEKARAGLVRLHSKEFTMAMTEVSKVLIPSFDMSLALAALLHQYDFKRCVFVYNHFKSAIAYNTIQEKQMGIKARIEKGLPGDYEVDGDEDEFLQNFAEFSTAVQFHRMMLETGTTEQSQRMAAMESSTKNAEELSDALTLQYNRSRQQRITTELIEIISGASALE